VWPWSGKPRGRRADTCSATDSWPSVLLVIRWLCALLVGVVVSGFAFLLVTGRYINRGPVVAVVTPHHGLHEGDLFVLAGWAFAILALIALVALPGRRSGE
jgi:hypothetical protein